ncbi:4'-phosphopantetheinyl transferase superfamily protein [Streptomyces sp. TBY4]|uniref:4'-phosphopantetheinyl transferase family protein n=1 Tax=Streptomyces sp. TBY4 TaxID=2962030 RepID=UPI0020B8A196|nr:4'-phosphopantetheinyl transferase superfamily protein [Streptomyces sp. TBY4]MCP3757259.1 4'-phosphopantetheinyl transferase superfamily protein [Streptomyces sp. TBY4]
MRNDHGLRRACHIWWADALTPSSRRYLSPEERERGARLPTPGARRRHATAAALLRLCVSHYTGLAVEEVRIDRTCPDCDRPHGRPEVHDSDLHVSVTHAGGRVGVALTAAGPVGLDVELVDPAGHLPRMDRYVFSPAETPGGAEDFYRCWVRKEALLKATGDGLRRPMSGIEITGDPPVLTRFPARTDLVAKVALRDTEPGEGYLGAVCVLSPDRVEFTEQDGDAIAGAPPTRS